MNLNKSEHENVDVDTVEGFGDEWTRFNQNNLLDSANMYNDYFSVFPWNLLPENAVGADVGCGSGRWALVTSPKVAHLHLVDASDQALAVAKKNLVSYSNCSFHHCSLGNMPIPDESLDFAYSLGVLHHIPDTQQGIRSIAQKLKPGGIFLGYIYYKFDNRPYWFKLLWKISDLLRRCICKMPYKARYILSQFIAIMVYWPLARTAALIEKIYRPFYNFPLFWYRKKSFYSLRTDALDRFGTRLEKRFTKQEIAEMLERAGFDDLVFSENAPFWCVSAIKKRVDT
jgi:ubiquinone/menaquinone biosynthesis C-methylase UbiE